MSKDHVPNMRVVVTTHKAGVIEHTFAPPGPLNGSKVIRLDMEELGETRWRLRTPSGNEARITEATLPHTQETRNRNMPGLYIMEKGWGACCTIKDDFVRVAVAFANTADFYLHVPAGVDYVVRFGGPAAFTFASPDKTASSPVKDDLYDAVNVFSDESILALYAEQHGIGLASLARLVTASMTR